MQAASLTAPATGAGAAPTTLEHGNQLILDASRSFTAPEGIFQLPRVESGSEDFEIVIPPGLQLSLIDLATPQAGTMSGAEIEVRPAKGSTGTVSITVNWSHPVPMGNITFQLRVYASPDGHPPKVFTPIGEPGSQNRVKALFEQDAPVGVVAEGPIAKAFHDQVISRGGQVVPANSDSDLARLSQPMVAGVGTAAVVVISLAVIAAICIVIGLATFASVLFYAMNKGYDVKDAGYKTAVGEGDSRQEHEMVFNLEKPSN